MVKKQDEIQDGNKQVTEKSQNVQQRVENRKPYQQARNRVNNPGYHQNQRGQNQFHQKNSDSAAAPIAGEQASGTKEVQTGIQSRPVQAAQSSSQSRNQSQYRNNTQGTRSTQNHYDGYARESGQNKGYYRDRNKDSERVGKYGGSLRNRPEETIDDIKEDITRLEKEIELEIKEINSMKL